MFQPSPSPANEADIDLSRASLRKADAAAWDLSQPLGPQPSASRTWRSPEEQRIIDVNKQVRDSVVFIQSTTVQTDPYDIFGQHQQVQQGAGSGFVIHSKGDEALIITNNHVIKDAAKIEILAGEGKTADVEVVGADPDMDVAVLRVKGLPKALPAVALGDSSQLEVGQKVLALGNPFGLSRTLTDGMISSLDRAARTESGKLVRYIQTNAAINPGNSGGPLLDMDGNVVAVNTMIYSPSGGSHGIGFAVPINQIKAALPDLMSIGRARWPQVGMLLADTTGGPVVQNVIEGSPAEAAGIRGAVYSVPNRRRWGGVSGQRYETDFERADFITKVNGSPVQSSDQVLEKLYETPRDQAIKLTVRRGPDGQEREVSLKAVWK